MHRLMKQIMERVRTPDPVLVMVLLRMRVLLLRLRVEGRMHRQRRVVLRAVRTIRVLRLQGGVGRGRAGAVAVMGGERLERVMGLVVLVMMMVMELLCSPLVGVPRRLRLRDDLRVYRLIHVGGVGGERGQGSCVVMMVMVMVVVVHLVWGCVVGHVVMGRRRHAVI